MKISKNELIEIFRAFMDGLRDLPEGSICDIDITGVNTGIEEVPIDFIPSDGYKRFIDLGGMQISLKINIQNSKDIMKEIEKAIKL